MAKPENLVTSITVEIEAPASLVWEVLTDFPRYAEWNTFCPGLETTAKLGDMVHMQVRIPGTGQIIPVKRPPGLRVARAMSRALNAAGLYECVSWSFVDPERLARLGWRDAAALIALQNPLSVERSVLRPSLVPGLLEVIAINANRQTPDVRVFEVGNVFAPHRDEDGDRPATVSPVPRSNLKGLPRTTPCRLNIGTES